MTCLDDLNKILSVLRKEEDVADKCRLLAKEGTTEERFVVETIHEIKRIRVFIETLIVVDKEDKPLDSLIYFLMDDYWAVRRLYEEEHHSPECAALLLNELMITMRFIRLVSDVTLGLF